MMKARLVWVVRLCTRYPWAVIGLALVLAGISAVYSARNFAINTNIDKLISPDLPWRQRDIAYNAAFPQRMETILAVVDAPTPELASLASSALVAKLAQDNKHFNSVEDLASNPFFAREGLLFQPKDQVISSTKQLADAQQLIQVLVADPSLRGLSQALVMSLAGIQRKIYTLDEMSGILNMFSTPIEDVLAGRPASFSWREMVSPKPLQPSDRRQFIEIRPKLDYTALEPGEPATNAVRQAATDLDLSGKYQARLRLTGPVPIQDEEFATLKENAGLNAAVSIGCLLTILWLALRSVRIIAAVLISIFIGLLITSAIGLAMVQSLNPISIAFAVLFVGIGVDFGIQYSVRYRAERYEIDNLRIALMNAARHAGGPLTLAAAATAAGFLSFLPTDYLGVSELGKIAGAGMIIAYIVSVTLLPALLKVMNPPGEPEPLGFAFLAPVDGFMERHRVGIIVGVAVVVAAGLPLLAFLQFDFNPMDLRSSKVESIATYLELRKDPAVGASTIDALEPSLAAAQQAAEKLRKLPEVSEVRTVESFIPPDQPEKLAAIHQAAQALAPALNSPPRPAPTDAEIVAALNAGAAALTRTAGTQTGKGADSAKRLSNDMTQLAKADPATREKAQSVFITPLKVALHSLAMSLQAEPVSLDTLPPELKSQWITPDGRARVEVYPKGDPDNNDVIRQFASAVLTVEPNAVGGPIAILESGKTVVRAFIEAGIYALLSIAVLLWIALRRFTDVLLTLIPLILAGVVTLELCVLLDLQLNFANIIALPLLLGIGVAFKIYYIMAWRAGQTGLLESSLTRAVIFSALTTATAFGSLWLSNHPGTSSMGKLLALSLVCTLAAAVLFQPVLMGPPRKAGDA